jgi:hypothetical protein
VKADRELILDDASSLWEGLQRMVHYAQEAATLMNARIEEENRDGKIEVVEVREAIERVQALSLELSEDVDADQNLHELGKVRHEPVGASPRG